MELTEDGVKQLVHVPTLEQVTLQSPKLTDASIDHLVQLKRLRKVQLHSNGITAAGRQKLQAALPNVVIQ